MEILKQCKFFQKNLIRHEIILKTAMCTEIAGKDLHSEPRIVAFSHSFAVTLIDSLIIQPTLAEQSLNR